MAAVLAIPMMTRSSRAQNVKTNSTALMEQYAQNQLMSRAARSTARQATTAPSVSWDTPLTQRIMSAIAAQQGITVLMGRHVSHVSCKEDAMSATPRTGHAAAVRQVTNITVLSTSVKHVKAGTIALMDLSANQLRTVLMLETIENNYASGVMQVMN